MVVCDENSFAHEYAKLSRPGWRVLGCLEAIYQSRGKSSVSGSMDCAWEAYL